MNVEGAAIATIFSEILTAVLVGYRLVHAEGATQLHFNELRIDADCLKQIVKFGFPTALQSSVIDVSNILIQSYINSFGSLAMAGIGASTKAEGFIFLPVTSFSMAMTTYISQNMGAEEYERVKKGIRFGYALSLSIIEAMGIILSCLPQRSLHSLTMIHRLLPMVLEEHVLVVYSLCLLDILILLLRFAEDLGNQQHQW